MDRARGERNVAPNLKEVIELSRSITEIARHPTRFGVILALAMLALVVGLMNVSASPPSNFMEQGSLGGDGDVRANAAVAGLDWANTGPTTSSDCSSVPGFTAVTGFTAIHLSGTEGLFDCGQFKNNTTVPIAPVPTANGAVGTNNIDAIAFNVDPLNTDLDTCIDPKTGLQTIDGDPTTYTGAGGEKNGDSLVVGSTKVETWGGPNNATPKNDVSNVYAVSRSHTTSGVPDLKEIFFGAERVINNGDSHFDFEFTQSAVSLSPGGPPGTCSGKFDGHRTHGDFIASIDYTTGGTFGTFSLSPWHCNLDTHSADNSTAWVPNGAANPTSLNGKTCDVGSGSTCVAATTPTTLADGSKACGTGPHYQEVACVDFNATDNVQCPGGDNEVASPLPVPGCAPGVPTDAIRAVTNTLAKPCGGWACRDGNGNSVANIDSNELMEGGVNLLSLGFTGCISTFIPHTRTAQSFTASLKDFSIIPFNTCPKPTSIVTEIHNDDVHTAVTAVAAGSTVHDKATVTPTGSFTPTGTVTFTFFTNGTCTGTGTPAGTVTLDGSGVAHPSTAEGPLAAGSYSFKAHYNGDSKNEPSDSACEPLQ